jgi:plasmid stabilization system protein ParE
MPGVELSPEIGDDFERILAHLFKHVAGQAAERVREIVSALDVLETNPLIGRPAPGDTRELIIGRGARGSVALYRYVERIDTVFVLAVRSQREAGYRRG